jgi:uncharacterized protein (DUF433 family)
MSAQPYLVDRPWFNAGLQRVMLRALDIARSLSLGKAPRSRGFGGYKTQGVRRMISKVSVHVSVSSDAVPKVDFGNIEKDVARCGGQPVIAGTRIRVATVLTAYRQGMSVEEIVQQYAGIKPGDVHDALAYAYDHLPEIESDIAADGEALVKSQQQT